jgi:hypothetical protein
MDLLTEGAWYQRRPEGPWSAFRGGVGGGRGAVWLEVLTANLERLFLLVLSPLIPNKKRGKKGGHDTHFLIL